MDPSSWLSARMFTAILICFLVGAFVSVGFGAVLAKRAGRPAWQGILPAFFLPWIGLAFIPRKPSGERYVTGAARYSMTMLFVSAVMVMIAVFLPWVQGAGSVVGQKEPFAYSPHQSLPVAIMVWLVALSLLIGAIGIMFKGGMPVAITTGIVVATLGGLLLGSLYLFGAAGIFLEQARVPDPPKLDVHVGPGGWIALVALVAAYVALLVVPHGLKVHELKAYEPGPPPAPPTAPQPPSWGQQQWGPQETPFGSRPQRPGASW